MHAGVETLGRLNKIDLREIWTSEAADFTPWLAQEENIGLLGDTIGIELEVEAQEKEVGPFRADILCKDTSNDQWVLIENQLERTDHTHLGQLLTYASGLNAVAVVWVARQFSDEHRAVMDWLNEITDDRFNFFGLEIELWRIDDSPPAPKFNAVCKPNDWTKTISGAANRASSQSITPRKQLQLEFWTGFREYVDEHGTRIKATKPLPQHWMNIAIGRSGFKLTGVASLYNSVDENFDSHEVRAELVLYDDMSKIFFQQLEDEKEAIEAELDESLTWHNPPEARMCRIYLRHPADLEDRESWPKYFRWLAEKLDAMHRAFQRRIKNLSIEETEPFGNES